LGNRFHSRLLEVAEKEVSAEHRYQGFILEVAGKMTRVLFVTQDDYEPIEPIEYLIPSKPMRKAGVYIQNQPFEVDGEKIRALATAESGRIEKIDLGKEYEIKLKTILSGFARAQAKAATQILF
jgi:hypothetical protein